MMARRSRRVCRRRAFKVLENARARIERPGGAFWLGGLADYESMRAKPSYGETLDGLSGRTIR
jgi:hypothetical protein